MITNQQKDSTLVPKDRIQELHRLLLQGEDFSELAKQFSDDKSSSSLGGKLKPFKSGQINSEIFENTAFGLTNKEDISQPIQTKFGWHILKLIDRKSVEPFESLKPELETQVGKDSRSQLIKAKMLEQLIADYQLSNQNPNAENIESNLSFNSTQNVWEFSNNFDTTQPFLTIQNKTYGSQDFLEYLNKNQRAVKKDWPINVIVQKQYASFLEQSVFQYKRDNLENENQEFANIINEYREGLLLFELMQDKIWDGAKNDSIGLQTFYNENKQNYVWPDRLEGSVARSSDSKYIKKVLKYWKNNKTNQVIDEALNEAQQNVIFSNGELEIGHSALPKSFEFKTGLSKVIKENANYYVVNVTELKPSIQKTFEEAKGQLISDYQTELELKWIQELRSKYTVKVNQDVLSKVKLLISN